MHDSDKLSALTMDDREIFDFVIRDVVKSFCNARDEAQDGDYFLLHQANARILEKVARKLKLPQERFLQKYESLWQYFRSNGSFA